jgi:hypothetical protein
MMFEFETNASNTSTAGIAKCIWAGRNFGIPIGFTDSLILKPNQETGTYNGGIYYG